MTPIAAVAMTTATAWIHSPTDEVAIYGHEGPVEQNCLPRLVAGWPAPFLADSPATSVIHKIGIEDDFRPGAFVADVSFWFLIVSAARRVGRLAKTKPSGVDRRS